MPSQICAFVGAHKTRDLLAITLKKTLTAVFLSLLPGLLGLPV